MKVAVLLSTYNGSMFLKKQMDSLVNQTVRESIYIYVRDDSSNDDTLSIIDEYRTKLNIVIYKGKNVGPAKSFWELLTDESIQADYFAFCDQDDIWDCDKLEKGIYAIGNSDKATLWCSNCRLIDSSDNVICERMSLLKPTYTICSQLVSGTTQGCAMVFNSKMRDVILTKKPSCFPMHDFVVVIYAILYGEIIYDESPSFSYRMHSNNVVAKKQKKLISRMKSTINRWFSKEHRGEVSKFARELLKKNKDCIDDETTKYIINLIKCKTSMLARIRIVFSPLSKTNHKSALRSFKIRTLLGII